MQMTRTRASTHSEGEIEALRDQLRDTSERLQDGLDGNALRERLALRQSELDEQKTRVHELEQRTEDRAAHAGRRDRRASPTR